MNFRIIVLALYLILLSLSGCGNQSNVVRLTEKQINEQELIVDKARRHFFRGNFDQAVDILTPLCRERTTSQPLYQCELGMSYLAGHDKAHSKECLMGAYSSIEVFFDRATEKRAVSLWGAESDKVFKGEPYEQATLSLLVGLLFLEEGDVDNALACFKNGQMADSDTKNEEYQSDYGLLQLLEAKCYQLRGEQDNYQTFIKIALDSFVGNHPHRSAARREAIMEIIKTPRITDEEKMRVMQKKVEEAEKIIRKRYADYYSSLLKPYNTLLLVWIGKSPRIVRVGEYQEKRVLLQNKNPEYHYEMQLDNEEWYDVIRGFSNISFQATTRGGRMMDDVLAGHASFKKGTANFGNAMFDAANNTSDPYAQLALVAVGLISHGVGATANAKADIRYWQTLPDDIGVIPLTLTPGIHTVSIDCYDYKLRKCRRVTQEISVTDKTFRFYNFIIPSEAPEKTETELNPQKVVKTIDTNSD